MTISTVAALQIGSSPKARPARWNACLPSNPRSLPPARRWWSCPRRCWAAIPRARSSAPGWATARPKAARPMRAITTMPSTCRARKPRRWRACRSTGASLVVGVIERGGSTLYCTALYFEPSAGLVAKHRKLMPTGTERLIWGQGDGSTLPVVDTPAGRVGGAICWETTCRRCAPPCMRKACRSGARPPWTSATSGNARCATSPTKPLLRDQRSPGAALARRAGPGRRAGTASVR